ncbi:MAG: SpoIIE family protein phosphatase [Vicingaceae bacterium]
MHGIRRYTNGFTGKVFSTLIILWLATNFFGQVVQGQINPELGQLPVVNYTSKSYKASPQNWAIAQAPNGLMYFGNNEGVLVYDGKQWDHIPTFNESAVRALDIGPQGKVYVGGVGDFGFISSDAHGKLVYVSLQRKFNLKEEDVEDVYNVNAFEDRVYYMTNRNIYCYNGKSLRVWESKSLFQSAYNIDGKYIVNQLSLGLCELDGDSLNPISKVNDFKGKRIYDIVSYSSDDMMVLTEKSGISQFFLNAHSGGRNEEYLIKVNSETKDFSPNNGLFLQDHILSIGTWGYGLLLVDKEGDIVQRLNSDFGLNDDVINDQFMDKDGNLWLATSNGISRVTLNPGISGYSDLANVNETVEAITEFNGNIFLATHTGLYYMDANSKSGEFQKIPGLDEECWGLQTFNYGDYECLLIAENNAVYSLDENFKLTRLVDCYPWTFHLFESDPSYVFVGLDDGLIFLQYRNGNWQVNEKIPGIERAIYSIAEPKKNELWLGSPNIATRVKLEWMKSTGAFRCIIEEFGEENDLPNGDVVMEVMGDQFLTGTSEGIFKYNRESGKFEKLNQFSDAMEGRNFQVHRLRHQEGGKLWMSAYYNSHFYMGYFDLSKSPIVWVENALKPLSSEVYHAWYSSDDEITWFGGPNGLYRYKDPGLTHKKNADYQVLIRNVVLNNDSIHYFGNSGTADYADSNDYGKSRSILPFEFNSLIFEFASQFHKYPEYNQYSYNLEGFTEHWSEWKPESKAVFTNLHEGYYKFRVKARNTYGQESEMAEFSFKIDPPWYRTWWAYFIYLALASLMVYLIVSIYTRNLKEIIREKTSEVVAQKDEIEKQKNEVEKQRFELEVKNADITSSINYAQRLQRAILPEDKLIKEYLQDSFVLYKPKDIVSGDFYWLGHVNGESGRDLTLFAAVDCTGHGVPGAFVSVVANGGLNRAVKEYGLIEPASILEKLNEIVVETLSKGENELRDGMDISLCSFDFERMEMEFAGANNSAYLVRRNVSQMDLGLNGTGRYHKSDLVEIRPNKQPVGYYEFKEAFVNNKIKIQKGDVIYLFSDGYADQFGGPRGKKYNYPRFKDFLTSIAHKPMEEQKHLIDIEFETWRGKEDQVDDIIVAGIRV